MPRTSPTLDAVERTLQEFRSFGMDDDVNMIQPLVVYLEEGLSEGFSRRVEDERLTVAFDYLLEHGSVASAGRVLDLVHQRIAEDRPPWTLPRKRDPTWNGRYLSPADFARSLALICLSPDNPDRGTPEQRAALDEIAQILVLFASEETPDEPNHPNDLGEVWLLLLQAVADVNQDGPVLPHMEDQVAKIRGWIPVVPDDTDDDWDDQGMSPAAGSEAVSWVNPRDVDALMTRTGRYIRSLIGGLLR